ncbi:hypothetical protein [Nocardia sp. NPDC002869]|uniref:hypothetical protein n=1 Tax=Nocardia sp. NPDC002869 TaxID=3161032 RepID=UPI00398C855E
MLSSSHRGHSVRARGRLADDVETGFAQLPEDEHKIAFGGNTDGWAGELAELVQYLDAA